MRRLFLLFITLTLATGCSAPAPAAVTPIMRVISAQEAGAIIADATSTGAAMATQGALATATEISARATSTAAWRQTQDAVAAQQTLAALDLTRAAGQGAATEIAAVKTQAAGQTATWGPPTLEAVATRAAATERALVAADAAATAEAQFRQGLRQGWNNMLIFVTALVLVGLGAALALGIVGWFGAREEMLKAQADRERAQAQQLLVMQYGGYLLQLSKGGQRWEVMPPPGLPAPSSRAPAVPPAEGGVREVPIKAKQEIISHIPVGVPETPERERVLGLLRAAIGLVGSGARHIPPAGDLQLHPMDWQQAVDRLKWADDHPAYVEVKPGRPKKGENGTRLVHPSYRTLGQLLDGVKRGDVLPPTPSEPTGGEA